MIYLPNVTVSTCAVVVVIGSLGSQVAQVELALFKRAETAHSHGTCWALRSVQTAVIALNVGVSAFAIGRIDTWSCHTNSLLGHEAGRCASKLLVVVVRCHFYSTKLSVLSLFQINKK